jgi:hypothetical protein
VSRAGPARRWFADTLRRDLGEGLLGFAWSPVKAALAVPARRDVDWLCAARQRWERAARLSMGIAEPVRFGARVGAGGWGHRGRDTRLA